MKKSFGGTDKVNKLPYHLKAIIEIINEEVEQQMVQDGIHRDDFPDYEMSYQGDMIKDLAKELEINLIELV